VLPTTEVPIIKQKSSSVVNPSAASDLTFEVIPTKPGVGSFFLSQIGLERRGLDRRRLGLMGYPSPQKISQFQDWDYLNRVLSIPCLVFSYP